MKRTFENENPFEQLRKAAKAKQVAQTICIQDTKNQIRERFPVDLASRFLEPSQLTQEQQDWLNSMSIFDGSDWKSEAKFIGLKHNEAFSFLGKVNIAVLKGKLNIHGYELMERGALPVYSPSTNALIECVATGSHQPDGTEFAVVLVLVPLRDRIERLESLMPVLKGMFTRASTEIVPGMYIADESVQVYNSENAIKICSSLAELNINGNSSMVFALIGGRNSGKSSHARFIVNYLLNERSMVAFLECDPGQPEFTPNGLLSLHLVTQPLLGPALTHQRQPSSSKFFGYTTPKNNPDLYLELIFDLIREYKKNYSEMPLVVNTCGWVKGVGFDILSCILRELSEPNMILLKSEDGSRDLVDLCNSHRGNVYETNSVSPEQFSLTKYDFNLL